MKFFSAKNDEEEEEVNNLGREHKSCVTGFIGNVTLNFYIE
jgi:hypothetical protein